MTLATEQTPVATPGPIWPKRLAVGLAVLFARGIAMREDLDGLV